MSQQQWVARKDAQVPLFDELAPMFQDRWIDVGIVTQAAQVLDEVLDPSAPFGLVGRIDVVDRAPIQRPDPDDVIDILGDSSKLCFAVPQSVN